MKKLYYIPIEEHFINTFVSKVLPETPDYSRLAVVFPNKRPFLFLRRALHQKFNKPFIPPASFTMDTFIFTILKKSKLNFNLINNLDLMGKLFEIVSQSNFLFKFDSFEKFFPWAEKIARFLNQIDTENISNESLKSVAENAAVGYEDVPEQVNNLLMSLIDIRLKLHQTLEEENNYTRGLAYSKTLSLLNESLFSEFDKIYFAGLFALTKSEQGIIKYFWKEDKADVVFNADPNSYPLILKSLKNYFAPDEVVKISSGETFERREPQIFSSFDIHSEIVQLGNVLKNKNIKNSVIVLPRPDTLFPLLSLTLDRVKDKIDNFNISLQYPLIRTSLFSLVEKIVNFRMQKDSNQDMSSYKTKEYMQIVSNPFLKNVAIHNFPMRIFVNLLRNSLNGKIKSPLNNQFIFSLSDLLAQDEFVDSISKETPDSSSEKIREAISLFHKKVFSNFENVNTLNRLIASIETLLNFLMKNSDVKSYILSGEILQKLFNLLSELKKTTIADQEFSYQFFSYLFSRYLQRESIIFATTPLQDLEIIGMLETRNLNFESVYILDVQDDILPGKRTIDSLIPLEVYNQLNLPNYEKKLEMNKYYFDRLVKSGKEVNLFYVENEDKERSRFIEKIIWDKEKEETKINAIAVKPISFSIKNLSTDEKSTSIQKNDIILKKIKNLSFSASSLDTYINCGLKFYYSKILGLSEESQIAEELDGAMRGSLVHKVLENTYKIAKTNNQNFSSGRIEEVQKILSQELEKAFMKLPMTGETILLKKIAELKLKSFIANDLKNESFIIESLEGKYNFEMETENNSVLITGKIDRIDLLKDKIYRIIDYKTSTNLKKYNSPKFEDFNEQIEEGTVIDYLNKKTISVQLPLYIKMFQAQEKYKKIPLDKIEAEYRNFEIGDAHNKLSLFAGKKKEQEINKEEYMKNFDKLLNIIIDDILNPSQPFEAREKRKCEYCEFNKFCPSSLA